MKSGSVFSVIQYFFGIYALVLVADARALKPMNITSHELISGSSILAEKYGYVGNSFADDLAVFQLLTGPVVSSHSLLPEANYPYDATMRPDGSEVWFVGASGDGVMVFDTTTQVITHRLNLAALTPTATPAPTGSPTATPISVYCINVTFTKDNNFALVSNRDTEDVTVIDTATYSVSRTIPIPTTYLGAGNMALNPCSGDIYVVDWYSDNFSVIDPGSWSIRATYSLGDSLWQLVVSPDGEHVFITDRGTDQVRILETTTFTEIAALPVGDDPWGIDITPDGRWVYVANEDSHDVTVIDATTLTVAVPSITLPPHGTGNATPRDVDIDLQGTYVYIPSGDINYGTVHDYVYVIAVGTHLLASSIDINPHRNPNVVAVAPQMYECAGSVTPTPTPLTIPVINLCLTMFLLLSMPACMCLKKTGIPLFKILLKNLRF